MHRVERLDVGDRAVERDSVAGGARPLDRHQPRTLVVLVRLHHEMRHATCDRVDDDVREIAERSVGALDLAAELKPHATIEPRRAPAVFIRSG